MSEVEVERFMAWCYNCGNFSHCGLNFKRLGPNVPGLTCAKCGASSNDFEYVRRSDHEAALQALQERAEEMRRDAENADEATGEWMRRGQAAEHRVEQLEKQRDTALLRLEGADVMRENLLARARAAEKQRDEAVAEFERRAEAGEDLPGARLIQQAFHSAADYLRNQRDPSEGDQKPEERRFHCICQIKRELFPEQPDKQGGSE